MDSNTKSLMPFIVGGIAVMGWFAIGGSQAPLGGTPDPVAPSWAAIAAWPSFEPEVVEAMPDPNRRVTAIVLDDSGSMGADMDAAKRAVVDALGAMAPEDRVAVIALNDGTVLPFTRVADAREPLVNALAGVQSNGSTPLTRAVRQAESLLEAEAGAARGFGTFRLIVTTDGAANEPESLENAIEGIARDTPIQITTIGIAIEGGHVLRRSDLGSFVDVADVDALRGALEAAVAENASFDAITDFEGEG